jgi:hypothetical protein
MEENTKNITVASTFSDTMNSNVWTRRYAAEGMIAAARDLHIAQTTPELAWHSCESTEESFLYVPHATSAFPPSYNQTTTGAVC